MRVALTIAQAVVWVGLCLLVAGISQAQVTSTRVSEFDWRCTDEAGARISDHQRFDTAFVACLNAPNGAYVQGGRYRVTRGPVVAPTAGTATLRWTPPTRNTDGTTLTNLAGYRIHYGTSPAALTLTAQVPSPNVSSYAVSGLSPGTYFFGIRAYTSGGAESDLSNVASKVIL